MAHSGLGDRVADWANARQVASYLRPALSSQSAQSRIEVAFDRDAPPKDVLLERIADGYRIRYSRDVYRSFQLSARLFLRAYLGWFDATDRNVASMDVNASDGDEASLARFSASSRSERQIPLPDPHFYESRGFEKYRRLAAGAPGWPSRSEQIVWRGGCNGFGRLTLDRADANDPGVLQRERMIFALDNQTNCDVKFSDVALDRGAWAPSARRLGILGEPRPEAGWLGMRYAIDIDGHTNTWSNLLVRLLFGCCVFKVASPLGFRQWYYDRLVPFEHYVPVRADLTDFAEKIDWARSRPSEAQRIAEAGRNFAMALDFEAGRRDAVRIISANWAGAA